MTYPPTLNYLQMTPLFSPVAHDKNTSVKELNNDLTEN